MCHREGCGRVYNSQGGLWEGIHVYMLQGGLWEGVEFKTLTYPMRLFKKKLLRSTAPMPPC